MFKKRCVLFITTGLRFKVLMILLLLAIYRIGWQIPLPMIDQEAVAEFVNNIDETAFF